MMSSNLSDPHDSPLVSIRFSISFRRSSIRLSPSLCFNPVQQPGQLHKVMGDVFTTEQNCSINNPSYDSYDNSYHPTLRSLSPSPRGRSLFACRHNHQV